MVSLSPSSRLAEGFVRPNLAECVAKHLRSVITQPDFGARLPGERQIADSLGVSRPVVREALAKLASDAVIVRRPGYPTLVAGRVEETAAIAG